MMEGMENRRLLILKTGAIGDVVRTTCLLQIFHDYQVTWITHPDAMPVFQENGCEYLAVYSVDSLPREVRNRAYDMVISLEENEYCASLAGRFTARKFTGVYWNNGLVYTKNASLWFDMSLISALGFEKANQLKKANSRSYQEFLFAMVEKPFSGEAYKIYEPDVSTNPKRIGLETTAGHRWPNKAWKGYEQLAPYLEAKGFELFFFEERPSLRAYMEDIKSCSMLVCGDTLAMHLAMAYRVPVVGLFTCTSPDEIYDYGLLKKIISPSLNQFYYDTAYNPAAGSAIPVPLVVNAVVEHWNKFYTPVSQIAD